MGAAAAALWSRPPLPSIDFIEETRQFVLPKRGPSVLTVAREWQNDTGMREPKE
jgi:hypothetical protein